MRIKNILLNVLIGVLCFTLLITMSIFIFRLKDADYSYSYEESSMLYAIQDQDYSRLVEMYHTNEAIGVEPTPVYEECYAVARFFEAATYYKAYLYIGDEKLAKEKYKVMEEQTAGMGELSYLAEDIREILGIE